MAPVDTYNELVLGETQAGNSAIIDYIKRYADQEFSLNANTIGSSSLSHTTEVAASVTDPPEYHVPEKKGVGKINYKEYVKVPDKYDCNDLRNMHRGLITRKGESLLKKAVRFNMIGPRLNATGGNLKHVQKIFDGVNKPKAVHLHLTTIGSGPLAQGPQGAIEFYRNKFPGVRTIPAHAHFGDKSLRRLISLPHAIDLASLHATAATSLLNLKTDLYYKTVIIRAQETIQNVLEPAMFDNPDMPRYSFNIARMSEDSTSGDEFEVSTIDQAVYPDEGYLLAEILRESLVTELEVRINVTDDYFLHDVLPKTLENRQDINFVADGGKGIQESHPILHVNTYTAKFHLQQEHKKLVQELQEATQRQNHLVPLTESRRQQIKEIVSNHSQGLILGRTLSATKKYSVLVLGKTQAGKTALVEHMMSYATPSYAVDQSLLGDGTSTKTERTRTVHTRSSLPSYEVYDKASGTTIDFNPGEGDEEDIRDLLFSRGDNVGLRPAPGIVSDAVEFELLDTPGLCNQDKEDDQAADIVGEIISTRSFNLILIVVNIHDPLTAEQLIALRYFSKILHGLHSNIAFLYTHADYGHYLLPNKNRQLALANRTRSLSRIFQGSVSGDLEPYPSFTISLTEKRLPFVQCLMQNTLRDILQLAVSNPPVLMDTSNANLERINRIGHPSDLDDLQREMFLARIYGEWCLQANLLGCSPSAPTSSPGQNTNMLLIGDTQSGKTSPAEIVKLETEPGSTIDEEPIPQGSVKAADETPDATTKHKLSVLVLGKTQSGKSCLIQNFKQYADPTYTIDQSLLGNGNTSRTEFTEDFFFCSDLPAYEVVEIATGTVLDLQNLGRNEGEFLDMLKGREDKYVLRKVHQDPNVPSDLVEFRFLDTPGLNDTGGRSVAIAADVLKEITETRSFDLILVTVSAQSPLTLEYRLELEYYAKVLQGLHSKVVFLYTHVDYANCHHSNINHRSIMSKRHSAFSEIFQGLSEDVELFKHFTIDLLASKRPVVQCLIWNTLRDILQLAVTNPPAVLDAVNLERIQAIAHPDKANRACREKFRAMQAARAVQMDAGAERAMSQHGVGEREVGPVSMAALSDADSDVVGFSSDFGSVDEMESDRMDI
ncbi:hypothetical protein BGZ74_009745 [Mortierella antarctica]|nr:hypothetical protein BGZ74_009745 [Mortierella antarctica]